jgi:hypothetical protein
MKRREEAGRVGDRGKEERWLRGQRARRSEEKEKKRKEEERARKV